MQIKPLFIGYIAEGYVSAVYPDGITGGDPLSQIPNLKPYIRIVVKSLISCWIVEKLNRLAASPSHFPFYKFRFPKTDLGFGI